MRVQHYYLPKIAHYIYITIFLCSVTEYAADHAKNKYWFVEETGINIAKKQQFPECLG